ncbi:MAG TPA: hypothetical protein PLL66_04775 [Bacteroidales bacterium]|nr:hypothetical protein [Bacteroidales bacterium]
MEITTIQIVGYAASFIIALSMTMNSIVKFRWINLVGATTMSTYGFIFGAIPVGILNAFILSVDIYYLIKIYSRKEKFETLGIRPDNRYLLRFLSFHNKEIQKFFPGFKYDPDMNTVSFFVLRDMVVTGVFLAHKTDDHTLKVGLDYVIPAYRDFKNGRYIYLSLKNLFLENGITKIMAKGNSIKYVTYLKKIGFTINEEGLYEMEIT